MGIAFEHSARDFSWNTAALYLLVNDPQRPGYLPSFLRLFAYALLPGYTNPQNWRLFAYALLPGYTNPQNWRLFAYALLPGYTNPQNWFPVSIPLCSTIPSVASIF
jgi:hypothetical protein